MMLPCITQLVEYVGLAGFVGMKLQAKPPKPDVLQTAVYHFERRSLLRDEKDGFSLAQRMSDQIADGLALTRPRRTDDNKVLAAVSGCRRDLPLVVDLARPM